MGLNNPALLKHPLRTFTDDQNLLTLRIHFCMITASNLYIFLFIDQECIHSLQPQPHEIYDIILNVNIISTCITVVTTRKGKWLALSNVLFKLKVTISLLTFKQ